ncbi:MAG TPA: hypothetical protein PLV62_13150 [Spirochaetota bacterium]|jgi:hypothetical protein|nr:hypothetical protein [Spirochaetota bacterium]
MSNYGILEFPIEVIAELKHYVYRLIDPRNGETFYVGKGQGNRVFQHIKCININNELDELNDKLQIIREINIAGLEVIHIIHRHGMTNEIAVEVEAALIDAYPGTTNIMGGYGSNDFGPMNVKEIVDKYSAETAIFEHKLLMITINNSILERSVYDATRLAWKINKSKANKAEYVLAVSKGIIKDVFEVDSKGWRPAIKINFPEMITDREERFGFSGKQAPTEILNKYVNKRVPDNYRKKGAANPIKYNFT